MQTTRRPHVRSTIVLQRITRSPTSLKHISAAASDALQSADDGNVSPTHAHCFHKDRSESSYQPAGSFWGLDLRVKHSPLEMLPNLFAGPQQNRAKHTRRYRINTKKRKLKNHDLRAEGYHLRKAEGNGWLPKSASAKTKAFGPKGTASTAPKVTNGHPEA